MMLIVRLYPKKALASVWKALEKNVDLLETKNYTALYATQLSGNNYVSVIFELKDLGNIEDFYMKVMEKIPDIRQTETLTLMKTEYYLIPKNRPEKLSRFQIHLNCEPEHYAQVFEKMREYKLPSNIFKTFISFSFGQDDIIMSVLSNSADSVLQIVEEKLAKIPGVSTIRFTHVVKCLRLVNNQKWKEHKIKYLGPGQIMKGMEVDDESTIEDFASLTGCFVHELKQ